MKVTLDQFSRLVASIYEAALDPSRWESTLAQLVTVIGSRGGALLVSEPDSRRFKSSIIGSDSMAVRSYNDYYGRFDPVAAALDRAPSGTVFCGRDVITPDLRRHSEFYNDWANRIEAGDGVFASLIQEDTKMSWLCFSAPLRPEPFGTPERLRLVRRLAPHMQQAIRAQSRLGDLNGARDVALEALEYLTHGVVLADHDGKVLFANTAAVGLSCQSDGLSIRTGGWLQVALRAEEISLGLLIHQAGGCGQAVRSGGALAVSRPSGRRPFAVHVLPLGPAALSDAGGRPAVLVLIVDPERELETQPFTLQRVFGLTKAEATVAICVLRGEGLQVVADELSVSLSTVRIQLQRVFEKTGTHRQAELVRLLLGVQAGISEPSTGGDGPRLSRDIQRR